MQLMASARAAKLIQFHSVWIITPTLATSVTTGTTFRTFQRNNHPIAFAGHSQLQRHEAEARRTQTRRPLAYAMHNKNPPDSPYGRTNGTTKHPSSPERKSTSSTPDVESGHHGNDCRTETPTFCVPGYVSVERSRSATTQTLEQPSKIQCKP